MYEIVDLWSLIDQCQKCIHSQLKNISKLVHLAHIPCFLLPPQIIIDLHFDFHQHLCTNFHWFILIKSCHLHNLILLIVGDDHLVLFSLDFLHFLVE